MKYSKLIKLVKDDGWYEVRTKGSHIIMYHKTKGGPLTVPFHGSGEVRKGTLRGILKRAGIKTNKR